jgi:outer membrane receptor protein involved in Fe transport
MNHNEIASWGVTRDLALAVTTASIALCSQTAHADQADGAPIAEALQEIVVTAEKRSSTVQETALSLTALSGADLQAQGIADVADAARLVPGVAQTTAGPGQTEYTIRGLSSSGAAVSTVGFYLDDVPMTAPSGSQNGHVVIDPDLYDLNRVEILRGPQGTLYGSGSMGGTVKLVTNAPDVHTLTGSAKADASVTESGDPSRGADAMLNFPLIDGKLALRVVGTAKHIGGWIDRVVLSDFPLPTNPGPQCPGFSGCTRGAVATAAVAGDWRNVNYENLEAARASLRYAATDALTLTASALYQRITQGGLSYIDNPPLQDKHYQPFDLREPFADTFYLYNFVGELALPEATLTSVSSYWKRWQSQIQDVSETIQTAFGLPSFYPAAGGAGAVPITEVDGTRQFSEELRLTSTGGGPWQWLVGAYYSDYHYRQDQYSLASGFVTLFGSDNLFTGEFGNHGKQTAEFGELSYKFGGFKATVGLRHYAYTWAGVNTTSGIAASGLTPVTNYTAASNSGQNPKFTFSYEMPHEFLAYATVAKGFRPGAGNEPVPITGNDSCLGSLQAIGRNQAPTQYNPDTVQSYEIGQKATLLDRRLELNLALYYERWRDVQQTVALSCGYRYTDNVGAADIRGGELEINARLSSSWTLTQTAGYTRPILERTEPGTGFRPGDRLLNVPTYSTSTSLIYTHPLGENTVIARLSDVTQGAQQAQNYFTNSLPAYSIVNARVGLETSRWSAFLYCNNLTNKMALLSYARDYALDIPSMVRVATNQPRTVGASLEYHY